MADVRFMVTLSERGFLMVSCDGELRSKSRRRKDVVK